MRREKKERLPPTIFCGQLIAIQLINPVSGSTQEPGLARVNSIQIENAGDNGSNKPEFYAPQITTIKRTKVVVTALKLANNHLLAIGDINP